MCHYEVVTDWIAPELLGPAFKAVRKALRDLDPDDVPAALRRIAGQSSRRLPPPLARKLMDTLDENEWLRDKAVEADADLDPASPDPARAVSALFLQRPDGWEAQARAAAERRAEGAQQALVASLQRKVGELERQLEAAREKAKATQDRAQTAEVESDKKVQAARSAIETARQTERAAADELRLEHAALLERHQRLADDLEVADRRIAMLRDELLKARRSGGEEQAPTGPQAWAARDPLAMARVLDEISEALRPESVEAVRQARRETAEPLVLPVGVGPDGAAAIRWLLARTEPFVLVVDGYNVTFLLDPDAFTDSTARERLNEGLARFRRMAAVPAGVIVVYDSTQSGGVTTRSGPGGIEVRFTEAGLAADDEIIALAAGGSGDLVVVSTDRRVREGAEEAGALGLWSQALVEWLERR